MSSTNSSSSFPMADSLIAHTAQQFLEDGDAFVWGRCSSSLLRAMRTYRIRRMVPMVQLLCRSEGRGLLPALESEEFRTNPNCWPRHWGASLRSRLLAWITAATVAPPLTTGSVELSSGTAAATVAAAVLSTSSSDVPAFLYSGEIGRVSCVRFDTLFLKDDQIMLRLVDLPPCVTSIELTRFHGSHPIRLSSTCSTLKIGCWAKRSSGLPTLLDLPDPGLRELLFDPHCDFNEPLEHLRLPSTLHTLHLGYYFNQPVEHIVLPTSLTDLRLGTYKFNQPVEGLRLPDGLRSLSFAQEFNHPIERLKLPSSLTFLDLGFYFNHPLVEWHPPISLTQFMLGGDWKLPAYQLRLPPSLLDFTLPYMFEHPISDSLLQLPSTLRSFQSKGWFNQSLAGITQWPESLTSISLRGHFSQPMDDWTPPSQLLTLYLGNYEWPIHRLRLPPTLTSLALMRLKLTEPAEVVEWPPLLRHLELWIAACASPACVIRTLPTTLIKFSIGGLANKISDDIVRAWLSIPIPTGCQREEDAAIEVKSLYHAV